MQAQVCKKDINPLTKRFSFLLDVCSQSEVRFIEEFVGNSIIYSLDDIIEEAIFHKTDEIINVLEKTADIIEKKLGYHNE